MNEGGIPPCHRAVPIRDSARPRPDNTFMLDRCPRCEYLFAGLPPDHACPECGLRYDRASRVHRQRTTPLFYTGVGGFAVINVLQLLVQIRQASGVLRTVLLIGWLLVIAVLIALSFYLYRLSRSPRFVCALPDGLLARHHGLKLRFLPWTNVSRVHSMRGGLGATVWVRDARRMLNFQGFFRSKTEVDQFVEYANSRVAAPHPEPMGAVEVGVTQKLPQPPVAEEDVLREFLLGESRDSRGIPYAGVVLLLILIGFATMQLGARQVARGSFVVAALTFVCGAVWNNTGPKKKLRVVIITGGLAVQREEDELFSCRWEDFERAEVSMGSFSIRGRYGAQLFMLPAMGRSRRTAACATEINRLKAIHGAARG